MKTPKRAHLLLGLAGLLALAGALLLRNPDRVAALPYIGDFKPFPLLFRSMVFSAHWGLIAVGVSFLLAALFWKGIVRWLLPPEGAREDPGKATSWVLFLVTFFLYILVERFVFLDYLLSPDEFVYLFQAKLLARGQWTVPAHPLQEFFKSAFIAEHDGRLFSIMPVGWSFMLAPALRLGIPWVLSPLCTALGVVLTYQVGRSIYGHRTGLFAALLMAVSPFVVFYSGSYMCHPASLLAFMVFLAIFARLERGKHATHLYVLLGIVTAVLPIIHNLEAFMLVPFLLLFVLRFLKGTVYPRGKLLLSGVVALALFGSFMGWYNHSLTGSAFKVPFQVYLDDANYLSGILGEKPVLGIYDLPTLKQRIVWAASRWVALNYCLFPLAPVLMFLPPMLRGRRKWDFLLLGSLVSLMVGYMFYAAYGGIQFGPRYYFAAVGAAFLLIADAFLRLASRVRPSRRAGFAFLIVLACVYELGLSAMLARFVPVVVRSMKVIQDAGAHLAEQGIHHSVILLAPSEAEPAMTRYSLLPRIRNSPDFDDDNLVAMDRGRENEKLMAFYPDRRFFLYKISILDLAKGKPMFIKEIRREEDPEIRNGLSAE